MIRFLVLFLLFFCFSYGNESHTKKFQKIIAFYKDEQYQLAQKNIEQYLQEYTKSPYHKALHQMLVYFYIKQNDLPKAIRLLETIDSLEAEPTLYLQYLDLLCQSKSFQKLLFALEKVEDQSQFQTKKSDLHFYKALAFFDLAQKEVSIEKKRTFFLKIKKLIKHPIKKTFQLTSMRMLFEIEAFFENHASAADLANKIARHDNKFAFYEAYHLLKTQPQVAIEKLCHLVENKHTYKEQAAFFLIQALLERQELERVCEMESLFQPFFHVTSIEIMYCKALIATTKLKQAQKLLQQLVTKQIDDKSLHFALVQLLKVSFDLEDAKAFTAALQLFTSKFANDEKLPLFEYHLAILYKNDNQLEKAIHQLLYLYEKPTSQKHTLLLSIIELNIELGRFHDAYSFSKILFRSNPDEKALGFFLHSITHLPDQSLALLELYLLQKRLTKTHAYQPQIQLMIAQKAIQMKKESLAISYLTTLLQMNESDIKAKAHFLFGLIIKNPILASHHLEIALTKKVEIKDKKAVWTRLFNLYNHLSTNNQILPIGHISYSESPKNLAAHFLYLTFSEDPKSLDSEHFVYLIDTYFSELMKLTQNEQAKRTIHTSEPLLHLISCFEHMKDLTFSEETWMALEKKRAITIGLKGWHQEKIEILSALIEKTLDPDTLCELYYEIGSSYQNLRLNGKAKKAFEEGQKKSGYHADLCALRWIQMHREKKDLRQSHLNRLKEISLNKSIQLEPLFLISALEYIDISLLSEKENQLERELFLMERFITDFSTNEDPFSLNYHTKRVNLEEKNRLWQAFMTFADYKTYYLRAKIEGKSKGFDKKIKDFEKQKQYLSSLHDFLHQKIDELFYDMKKL